MRDVDRLLAELEALDGGQEADVVRSALAAGVPLVVVLDELEREVQRRKFRRLNTFEQG